jgi:hypothetical protein
LLSALTPHELQGSADEIRKGHYTSANILLQSTPSVAATIIYIDIYIMGARGGVVVKALCYESESRVFETQRGE